MCAFMHYKVELYFHIFFVTDEKVTFDLCKYLVDEWILVSEEEISRAVYQFMENHHKVSQLHFFYCLKIFQLHFFSMFTKPTSSCSRPAWTTSMFIKDYYFPLPVLPSPSRDLIDCSIPGQEKCDLFMSHNVEG